MEPGSAPLGSFCCATGTCCPPRVERKAKGSFRALGHSSAHCDDCPPGPDTHRAPLGQQQVGTAWVAERVLFCSDGDGERQGEGEGKMRAGAGLGEGWKRVCPQVGGVLTYVILLFKEKVHGWLDKEDGISFGQNGPWVLHPDFGFRKSRDSAPLPSCLVQRSSALGRVLRKVTPAPLSAPRRCSMPGLPEEYLG